MLNKRCKVLTLKDDSHKSGKKSCLYVVCLLALPTFISTQNQWFETSCACLRAKPKLLLRFDKLCVSLLTSGIKVVLYPFVRGRGNVDELVPAVGMTMRIYHEEL